MLICKYLLVDVAIDVCVGAALDDADHDPRAVVHQPRDLLALPLVREHRADVACQPNYSFIPFYWMLKGTFKMPLLGAALSDDSFLR